MPLTTAKKAEIIAKFQQHEGDTGCAAQSAYLRFN